MKKMAVCITAYEFGGQSVVIEETTKRFAKFYDIDLYCTISTKPKPKWIKNLYYVKPWRNKYIPVINKNFIEQIKLNKYDVIHCHDSLPFMDAFYKNNIKYCVTCHGNCNWYLRDGLISKIDGITSLIFYRKAYKKANIIFAISKYIQDWLKKVYQVNSIIVYNGIDKDKFYPIDNKENLISFSCYPVLLYFGQISHRKGILDLIKTIYLLKIKYPRICLLIGGFGEVNFIKKVQRIINKKNLDDNIKLMGYISNDKQVIYYNSCDAVISASYWEGFGLPILEAYQCNKPIFVRNTTAMKEFVCDVKFKFNNVTDMAKKIDCYFSVNLYKKDYQRLSNNLFFDWDNVSDCYLAAFKKI